MLGQISLTRRTAGAGTHTGGYFVPGPSSDSTITGTWRPATERQLQQLADLAAQYRDDDPHMLYTRTQLVGGSQYDKTQPDLVSPDGGSTWYRVMRLQGADSGVQGWQTAHNRYLCVRQQEADG